MATDLVMVRSRACERRARNGSGFTLIDMLVSITIIGVLIGLMLPGLSRIRETTRRVVCGSNLRQHGLGIAMYADDYSGALAPSKFTSPSLSLNPDNSSRDGSGVDPKSDNQSQQTVLARTSGGVGLWDGLGWLFAQQYLPASGIYYCPSHHGPYPYKAIVGKWLSSSGELVTNYQYRGGYTLDSALFTNRTAIVADAMRTVDEYNHVVGCNVLRRDLSVIWFSDRNGDLASGLALTARTPGVGTLVDDAWSKLDHAGDSSGGSK